MSYLTKSRENTRRLTHLIDFLSRYQPTFNQANAPALYQTQELNVPINQLDKYLSAMTRRNTKVCFVIHSASPIKIPKTIRLASSIQQRSTQHVQ
mmetsp:Transcript_21739/g.62342  ORF Transcript_21739/g.62342 Transcript_21739/m.62342 type:complete len:95 (-) Transcript_21739:784-1068(-)